MLFGIDTTILAFVGLAVLAVGGIAYGLMYDRISSEGKTDQRLKSVKGEPSKKGGLDIGQSRIVDAAKRRQSMQKTLQDIEKQNAAEKKKLSLTDKFKQAGWKVSVSRFYMISILVGLSLGAITFILGSPPLVAGAALFAGGFGAPRWWLSHSIGRRQKAFLEEFPNAVDVIVRGIKAGLPLNDCLAIVANESKEPVASEFKKILETQAMGVPMTDAIMKLYKNIPLTETNFFGIVIAIQQGAGGNLSEALGNLAGVLRDRKKMKAKIQAMSAEAKASGMIIGSLPIIVGTLVYLTTPDYIMVLFTHPTGNLILLGGATWMAMGIMVMKSMINFDF